MKRTPLKRSAMRRKSRRPDPSHAVAYAECHRRPACEAQIVGVCTGRNEHAHHRRLRSAGGPTTSANLLAVCHACHGHIHANPAESHARGFILRAGDPIEALRADYPKRESYDTDLGYLFAVSDWFIALEVRA